MDTNLSLFTHTYIDNHAPKTLFLLHGTGGTEHDFLFLDTMLGKSYNFISSWTNKTSTDDITFLGYSNGANMILATLFYYPEKIKKAVLLHPMLPFTPGKKLDLSSHALFISYGTDDLMVPKSESVNVIQVFQDSGAKLETHEYRSDHQITSHEMKDVVQYLTTSAKTI